MKYKIVDEDHPRFGQIGKGIAISIVTTSNPPLTQYYLEFEDGREKFLSYQVEKL